MSEPTIAILGRPNVGKSTLFNRLVGKRKSIVSPEEELREIEFMRKLNGLTKKYNLIDTQCKWLYSQD